MSIFPGDVKIYRSNDSVEENEHQYPILPLRNAARATHITAKKAQHHHAVA